jgi:hypothetical protein
MSGVDNIDQNFYQNYACGAALNVIARCGDRLDPGHAHQAPASMRRRSPHNHGPRPAPSLDLVLAPRRPDLTAGCQLAEVKLTLSFRCKTVAADPKLPSASP